MKELKRENFDSTVRSGKDLILLFYKENHSASILATEQLKVIDGMYGRNFDLYTVDASNQKEIVHACGNQEVPEFISIKNTKIFKRSVGVLYTNQILDLLK